MKKSTFGRFVLLGTISIAMLTASAQNSHWHSSKQMSDPSWSELMANMNQMHSGMHSIQPSGDSDTDFVRLMLPHHQGAIDMAKTELMRGKDPQMRRLAQEIIADQQSEIQLMQLWQKQHQNQK